MIKIPKEFYLVLRKNFAFTPTKKQDRLLKLLSIFIFNDDKNALFLLKGFAGTGKTTVIVILLKLALLMY